MTIICIIVIEIYSQNYYYITVTMINTIIGIDDEHVGKAKRK